VIAASQMSWFVSRASGLMAWVLATASILWGLALSTKLIRRRGVPAWLLALHTYLGTLTLVFTAVHLAALVADNYVHFGASEILIPMASRWRPGAVAWGIVAFYLLIAVQVTSWLKRYLPRKLWHGIHLMSLPLFVVGTVHGFQAGADKKHLFVQWGALTGSALVLFLLTFRTLAPRRRVVVSAEVREAARRAAHAA
jgi:predicted ferric reductase